MIKFIVEGKVIGKQRPRFARKGNFVQTYTPQKTIDYEKLIKTSFKKKYPKFEPLKSPLYVNIRAFFVRAKSNKMTKPTIKPDIDNIIKSVLDSLNGLAYIDDKQVIAVAVEKYWGEIEAVKIEIQEMND